MMQKIITQETIKVRFGSYAVDKYHTIRCHDPLHSARQGSHTKRKGDAAEVPIFSVVRQDTVASASSLRQPYAGVLSKIFANAVYISARVSLDCVLLRTIFTRPRTHRWRW